MEVGRRTRFMAYKDDTPQNTVKRISQILNDLGISTKEVLYEKKGVCYSCRITLANNGMETLNIGCNGKGITPAYALASGYAELMERLENKFLVNEAMRHSTRIPNGKPLHFRFFPDEFIMRCSVDDFFAEIKYLFPNYHIGRAEYACRDILGLPDKKINSTGCDKIPQIEWLAVPFARFAMDKSCKLENVPIILARANSSTGLCAGNTPSEAILQGIHEIFERYVLQQIYLGNITPPSFPDNYFSESDIAKRLDQLRSQGYIYVVKDMSLGRGFPVVGLVLTNTANGTTMFRLGADLDPEIALERCLTEIYQGRTEQESIFLRYSFQNGTKAHSKERRNEYKKSLRDGTGFYPNSIFQGKPTYAFQYPRMKRSGDSHTDLKKVIRFLHENGYDLLVRDNSFLGFCAYQVMIPGLSDQDAILSDIFDEYFAPFDLDKGNKRGFSYEHDAAQWPLYNLKSQTDVREFVEKHYPNDDSIRLAPYNTAPQNTINKHLLLFLMAVKNRDYQGAYSCYLSFMAQREEEGLSYNSYLACVESYVCCKAAEMSEDEIKAWLQNFYQEEIVLEVLSDFSNPMEIMKNYAFPTCFECNSCPLSAACHYQDVVEFERRIQRIQLANPINQTELYRLLN